MQCENPVFLLLGFGPVTEIQQFKMPCYIPVQSKGVDRNISEVM